MADNAPDAALFSRNENEDSYTARFFVTGEITMKIKAASLEEARKQALAELGRMDQEGAVDLDEVNDIDLLHVSKDPVMYRVMRDGKAMQTSRLQPGDEPRAPTEYGN